jgi:signal transduction histidine kinase
MTLIFITLNAIQGINKQYPTTLKGLNNMKKLTIIFILFCQLTAWSQEKTVVLSASLFNEHNEIQLADLEGWIFHHGHDPSWSEPGLDVSDWQEFKPTQLSPELEDEDNKVEGWFRIKIKLDDSFGKEEFYLERQLWAATDIFIDGEKIGWFGNTGANETPFKEFYPESKMPVPIELEIGREYILAMHIVNFEHPLMLRELRLKPKNLQRVLNLTGSDFYTTKAKKIKWSYIYSAATISITALLMVFFWVLVVQNQKEKIFRIIAILASIVFIHAIVEYYNLIFESSYTAKIGIGVIWALVAPFIVTIDLIIVEKIVDKRIPYLSTGILILFPPVSLLAHTYDISAPFSIVNSVFLLYFIYLVIITWKTLQRAQIAVIVGTVLNVLSIMIFIGLHKYFYATALKLENILIVIYFLSIPLSLLVYVAFRFNGILNDVRLKANELVQMSEEKKALLADQNVLLESQVTERTQELNRSLEDLKSTQTQLIHSEKMASLGELTAGIAHEIQNPLNFVNNFSEVSSELVDEMEEEIKEGNLEDVKEISADLKQNLEKINHHGQRASSIVKGMLEHSRTGDGTKELTDINKLADEYLRLSYHGLRAKDKSFNADFSTDFDESLPKVNVVPQDIGRVLLNLINNAFQVVTSVALAQEVKDYKPTVTVSTKKLNDKIEITVKDNGSGIPEAIKDKIFEPFFTTKPTGQGTGLGLSMSYDIITKGHGGELKVESKVARLPAWRTDRDDPVGRDEGSEFIVQLPINN